MVSELFFKIRRTLAVNGETVLCRLKGTAVETDAAAAHRQEVQLL